MWIPWAVDRPQGFCVGRTDPNDSKPFLLARRTTILNDREQIQPLMEGIAGEHRNSRFLWEGFLQLQQKVLSPAICMHKSWMFRK